jgi:hypothetical protein
MDYIREFDIRLEKEMYYAGETVYGVVILDTSENFKLRGTYVRYHVYLHKHLTHKTTHLLVDIIDHRKERR